MRHAATSRRPELKPPADRSVSRFPHTHFDALLLVSFGGPEGTGDVMPFLENVTRGRGVPPERLEEVAGHYAHFGGVSPLNEQNRALIAALQTALDNRGVKLPFYFGNRNWHPYLSQTIAQMADDGVERALALFTSAYSSYSSCRQYRENIYEAQLAAGPSAPEVLKLRGFYNHPGFVAANADLLRRVLEEVSPERRERAQVVFTAHSIPTAMAACCRYAAQLEETARLVAGSVGHRRFDPVYQSRSGPPSVPWLEPDVSDHLRALGERGVRDVVLSPIGFLSDHLEVLFDLDVEARELAEELGINLRRAPSVGTDPTFVAMLADLVEERLSAGSSRPALGDRGAESDTCGPSCCLPGSGRPSPWDAGD